jgi:hypothetical protein
MVFLFTYRDTKSAVISSRFEWMVFIVSGHVARLDGTVIVSFGVNGRQTLLNFRLQNQTFANLHAGTSETTGRFILDLIDPTFSSPPQSPYCPCEAKFQDHYQPIATRSAISAVMAEHSVISVYDAIRLLPLH